jgi:hypothetical protein
VLSERALARWRWGSFVALIVVNAGQLVFLLADLERSWDRGPVLRAIGLGATVVSLVALGVWIGVEMTRRAHRP